ncbi:MAG TPA: pyridoxamine 5'-phosphate oxidase family protein [Gemmataceae bacterium]|nr:pyridoxamine 5'-phosphate oxidase family protein [Gemmataceae bacterium]
MNTPESYQTPRTTVRRLPQRGVYDRAAVHEILDAGMICHVGFVMEGQPFVIPTIYVRIGERVCVHGSRASRMLRALASGMEACITVTLVDGLVLARSAFHHSMNYRSVIVFGTGAAVEEPLEKLEVLRALSEHVLPGRWREVRQPNDSELMQTAVIAVPIREASAKIRTGPPKDDEEDYALPVWAGFLPLRQVASDPIPDPRLPEDIKVPDYVASYPRGA